MNCQVAKLPKVAILLCTYNGQQYLAEQLDSFTEQTHTSWQIWASDDGSKDKTIHILQSYQRQWPAQRLTIIDGPRKGFVANFLSLTCNTAIQADYYAYSDQDDIWEADKIERAVQWLKTVAHDTPALYCSRTRLVDENNQELGLSELFTKPPSFANALMQSIGGGNTMVFNNAARALLQKAGINTPIVSHDWWAYIAITACGGKVFYDDTPTLRYRQYPSNLVGENLSWRARLKRIHMLWQGCFYEWNSINIAALQTLHSQLTPENRATLERFAKARQMSLLPRLIQLKKSGVYRQTIFGNLGLVAAAFFKKI